jgi:serine-type D-Ala-D-Ala endopeptidase (penicillin-binding protein 7)
MFVRAWRLAAITLALATLAGTAFPQEAAASTHRRGTRISAAASVRRAGARRSRRRARRLPLDGCYARCAIVIDPLTGRVLFEKNADRATPIASITKLMTAMVFLDQKPDLLRSVEVTREELYGGGHTQLRNGENVTLGDLLHMSLMASDNVATRVLARESGLQKYEFIEKMNAKSEAMKLTGSRFVEFTGLDPANVSTATDVATMLREAAGNDLIHSIMTSREYEFQSSRRAHTIGNTNRLLHSRYLVLGGKTGFISQAGYCFATWLRAEGRDVIAVVLGAPTSSTRFADVVRLVQRTMTPSVVPALPSVEPAIKS